MPSMTFPYNINTNDNNKHHNKSHGITFTVTNYDPIKLIISSKYSPCINFMMHKCSIKETIVFGVIQNYLIIHVVCT